MVPSACLISINFKLVSQLPHTDFGILDDALPYLSKHYPQFLNNAVSLAISHFNNLCSHYR